MSEVAKELGDPGVSLPSNKWQCLEMTQNHYPDFFGVYIHQKLPNDTLTRLKFVSIKPNKTVLFICIFGGTGL